MIKLFHHMAQDSACKEDFSSSRRGKEQDQSFISKILIDWCMTSFLLLRYHFDSQSKRAPKVKEILKKGNSKTSLRTKHFERWSYFKDKKDEWWCERLFAKRFSSEFAFSWFKLTQKEGQVMNDREVQSALQLRNFWDYGNFEDSLKTFHQYHVLFHSFANFIWSWWWYLALLEF